MSKRADRLFSLASLAGGMLAGAAFKRAWKLARHEDEPPQPSDPGRRWGEILVVAALQGAISALVRAAVGRGARQLTGSWPAQEDQQQAEPLRRRARAPSRAGARAHR